MSLLVALAQPREPGRTFRAPDLVELVRRDTSLVLDIRYATSRNFMKRPLYTQARAFLQRPAAEALARVNARLHAGGFGLVIFDAYRPWSVTREFWEATPAASRKYVANPLKGSRHNRGCAVDLSLVDRRTGKHVDMPSDFDEFSERAAARYTGGTPEERRMRDLLRSEMEAEGFRVNPDEWWHFDYTEWRRYRVLDIPFERLGGQTSNLREQHQQLHP